MHIVFCMFGILYQLNSGWWPAAIFEAVFATLCECFETFRQVCLLTLLMCQKAIENGV